jgi:rsbT antagonist protein RsbS
MRAAEGSGRIPLQLSRGCVVASIQVDLSDEVLADFKDGMLRLLHQSGARGVILDVSGVELMDLEDFDALRRAMSMAELMGARCLLAGLRPGVVSALVDIGVDARGVEAVLNLDEAFRVMDERMEPLEDVEPSEDDRAVDVAETEGETVGEE